jgi:DNA-binding response OmpR family regulator
MSFALNIETIPLADLPRDASQIEESPHRPVVLVVDDEEIIADTRAAILAGWGYAAMASYDAETALEMARVIPPEILITDVCLTGMNGVDLAIEIQSRVPDCKVILFSGQADSLNLLALARNAGHNFTLLQKPVHPAELLAHLKDFRRATPSEPKLVA